MGILKNKILFFCCLFFLLCEQVFSQEKPVFEAWEGELINSVCWAKSNVDKPGIFAPTPESWGMLYQWNRRRGWPAAEGTFDGLEIVNTLGATPWEAVNDPCPSGWRVPNKEEVFTLSDTSKVIYRCWNRGDTTLSSFTDKMTGNAIFLPYPGFVTPYTLYKRNIDYQHYWSSSQFEITLGHGYTFYLGKDKVSTNVLIDKEHGLPVRCVADEKCDSIVRHDTVSISAMELPYDWRDTTFKEGTKTGTYRIQRRSCAYTDIAYLHLTVQSESEKPYPDNHWKGVLYNGVCWAKTNVDRPGSFAKNTRALGMLYQWDSKKGWLVTDDIPGGGIISSSGNAWEAVNDPCPVGWRIPTLEEAETLDHCKDCYRHYSSTYGFACYFSKSTPDTLCMPMFDVSTLISKKGYWSSSGSTDDASKAWMFFPDPSSWPIKSFLAPHDYAFYVRCVTEKHDTVIDVSETIRAEDLPYEWGDTVFDIGTVSGTYRFQQNGCAFTNIIDLHLTVKTCPGVLINGVCWAESNVDEPGTFAATPEAWGMLYQWNRKKGWPAAEGTFDGLEFINTLGFTPWEAVNDPCPSGWRVPNEEEMFTLSDTSKVIYRHWNRGDTTLSSFTDKMTGNAIFLPYPGFVTPYTLYKRNIDYQHYWSSSQFEITLGHGYTFYLGKDKVSTNVLIDKEHGLPVRCVADEKCDSIVRHDTVSISAMELPYDWRDTTFKEGTKTGTYRIQRRSCAYTDIAYLHLTVQSESEKPYPDNHWKGVLYNGVCWAKTNVDRPGSFAKNTRALGMLYQWDSKKGWLVTDDIPGGGIISSSGNAWEAVNDPCPVGWRIPTLEEAETLDHCKDCYRHYSSTYGFACYFSKSTPDTLCMPMFDVSTLISKKGYWSSSGSTDDASKAWMFFPDPSSWPIKSFLAPHDYAFYVRCVTEKHDTVIDVSETIRAEDLPYEWGDTVFDIGTVSGTYRFQQNGCAFTNIIDLHLTVKSCPGVLINDVCWAEYNVAEPGRFANPGNAYGMLYQWNRRKGWPAMTPDSVSGWDSTLEPGDTWEVANDPCPVGWRMPTVEELKSLFDETRVNIIETGHDRVLATRYTDIATGNMVFFPHANYRDEHGVTHNVLRKEYWANSHHWALWDNINIWQQPNADGYSVRCVVDENACDIALTVSETICKEALPYTWHDTIFREGTTTGEYCIRRTNQVSGCDSIFYLYLTVDTTCGRPCKERGVLINGVCWAESNVDSPNTFAATPEAFGLLYQWNKRKGYSLKGNIDIYDWDDGINENPYWEAVNNPCPADWHIPNVGDIYTLLDDLKVTREWTQQNGVSGVKFTDKFSGNAIFFPRAGNRHIGEIIEGGNSGSGNYWSTTKEYSNRAVYVFVLFENSMFGLSIFPMPLSVWDNAYSVRCVAGRDTTGCSPVITDTSETICARDLPYPWGDTIFEVGTQSGVYRFQHISTVTGCDSIVTLRLTVHASDTSFFDGVCYGSPYDNHGFNLPAVYRDTVIHDTLQSVFGCDSVRTLYLTVNPKYNIPLYDTVCQGDAYTQHGFSLSNLQTDGVHTLSLSSQAGCDSTLTLHLTVHPVYDIVLYDTVCQGDAYNNHSFSFNVVNASLTHTQTFQTIHGCDSIVTLNLHIWPSYLFADTINLCEGDTITFHSHKLYKSGVYDDTLKSVHGCDSIYRLDLTVHSTAPLYFSDGVCYGSPYDNHGFHLSAVYRDTVVRDSFRSIWGCDSIRILSLRVHPVYDTVLYDTVCQGDSYHKHGFSLSTVQSDGLHTQPLFSRWGCDSVVRLQLTVHPVYHTLLYDSICPSVRYDKYGFKLTDITESLTRTRRLSTIHGCDSLVTLELYVYPTYFFPLTKHICEGDTFVFRGNLFYESGVYYDSLTTIHGCDSIYCLYLTVHPVYDVPLSGVLCEGAPYTGYGFHVTTPGVHHRYLQTSAGCDSTLTLTLSEEKKIEGAIGLLLEDCRLHGYEFFFEPLLSHSTWFWDMGDGRLFHTPDGYHTYADSGLYRVQLRLETVNGCENNYSYLQYVPPYLPEIPIHMDRQVIDEDYPTVRFRVDVLPGMMCEWDFGDGSRGEGDTTSHTYNATTEKYYDVTLQVKNADSCVTESRVQIEVVFLPKPTNTFSPNGDGINDIFMGDYRIEIIDRNGLRIFTGENGWDGTYQGRQAKEDTYFYRLHYRTANGERQKTGYVTLIR